MVKKFFKNWKRILAVGVLVLLLYFIYAVINFEFNPFAPWSLFSRDSEEVLVTPEKEEKGERSPQKNRPKPQKPPSESAGRWMVDIRIQGNLIALREVFKKKGKKVQYPKKYFTLSEFSRALEEEPRYQNAYFTLYLSGNERYGIYNDLNALLSTKVSDKSDAQGRLYLKVKRNF